MKAKIAAGCLFGVLAGLVAGAMTGIIFGTLVAIIVMVGMAIPAAVRSMYRLAWWIGGPIALLALIAANVIAIRGNYL